MAVNSNSKPKLDLYEKIKDFLIKLRYPNVSFMKEDEIIDILSTPNRKFLTKWIFTQIDEDFKGLSDLEISELVVNYGLCLKSKSVRFISGDLPIPDQMTILYNLLDLAFTVKNTAKLIPGKDVISVDDLIINVGKTDTNLFPHNGPKVTLTPQERKAKIVEFRKTIQRLEERLSNDMIDHENDYEICENFNDTISNLMKNLEVELKIFGKNSIEYTKNVAERNVGSNQPKLMTEDECLKKCKGSTTLAKEYLEHLDTLVKLKDKLPTVQLSDNSIFCANKNMRLMIESLSNSCKELHELNLI